MSSGPKESYAIGIQIFLNDMELTIWVWSNRFPSNGEKLQAVFM